MLKDNKIMGNSIEKEHEKTASDTTSSPRKDISPVWWVMGVVIIILIVVIWLILRNNSSGGSKKHKYGFKFY